MNKETRIIGNLTPKTLGNNNFVLPNTSGDHVRSIKRSVPVADADLANKKYVDDNLGGSPEGTAVKSTGELGASKYLREDGDDTCSWQTPAGAGDVTAAVNLTDETLVQGDGGAKGVKTSTATIAQIEAAVTHYGLTNEHIDWTGAANNFSTTGTIHSDGNITTGGTVDGIDIAGQSAFVTSNSTHRGDATGADHSDVVTAVGLNTAKDTNVTTNLSAGARTATTIKVDSSDGTDATLVEADTTDAGILGSDKWDEIVANTSAKHTQNSDTALGAQSEDLDMNTHQVTGLDAPAANNEAIRATAKITEAKMEAADDHVNDNTQAHSDYLLNSGADVAVGPLTTTADNSTADQAFVAMVLYNTDATPPAANTVPVGTIYVQYTA